MFGIVRNADATNTFFQALFYGNIESAWDSADATNTSFLPGTFLLKYQNHRLGCLSRWPSHFTKDWLNGFSANWESSICGRKLHYPGNRTQDLLQSGEVWQPFWCTFGLKKIKYQKCLVKCCDLLLLTHFAKMS